jgi:AraC family transcriptional regulator, regulatory protein of adaptative response / methylated-DNA-[protein]-cysteine methyltransferase
MSQSGFEGKGRSANFRSKHDLGAGHKEEFAMTLRNPIATESEVLRFAYGETALGMIMVAQSGRGIVALFIGDNRRRLLRDLEEAFPKVNLTLDQIGMDETIRKILSLIGDPRLKINLELDLRGSLIEIAIWQALQEIPVGALRTYGEIAKSLPVPATPQDVSAACGANRIAVAVPCHRVVKSDGSIAGYRWGVQRKRWLINNEAIW